MSKLPRATDKVVWRGVWLDRRTASALNAAEKAARKRTGIPTLTLSPSQGGWSFGSLSAGTHGRAATVDLRVGAWNEATRRKVENTLRDYGFAAWYRTSADGFAPHIHAIAFPPPGKGANGWTAGRAIGCLPALTGNLGIPGGGMGPRHGSAVHGQGLASIAAEPRRPPGRYIPNQMSRITEALLDVLRGKVSASFLAGVALVAGVSLLPALIKRLRHR